ncbi:hypothetical protein A2U01_0112867, partial [Trifolium medium]|nr:hypothetical protein [Trifolium medium]
MRRWARIMPGASLLQPETFRKLIRLALWAR